MGSNAITINEAVPIVSISKHAYDKRCFGVISSSEDPDNRTDNYGRVKIFFQKEDGDVRTFINSIGEGGVWVINTNGPLESGDYITTSNIAGYGMRQDDDILHSYTVAKITMDCDFNPQLIPKRKIKKEIKNIDYWTKYTKRPIDETEYNETPIKLREEITVDGITMYYKISREDVTKIDPQNQEYTHEVREQFVNVLDEHGEIQWEDDPSGATEKAYKIRYLTADGNITDEANAVHIAAFVGCTYHCG